MQLISSLIVLNLFLMATATNIRVKKTADAPLSLLNIPENLPIEDLHKGLSVLSTDELKTLSEYIDNQNKRQMENFQNKRETKNEQATKSMLDAMENYWARHIQAADSMKKKRNIDDLYDEISQENAEQPLAGSNENDDDFCEMEALGCTCRSLLNKLSANKNVRAKRENQFSANLEKGYSIEEYVRELENSFPREQDDKTIYEGETSHKNHLRIKRLKNSN